MDNKITQCFTVLLTLTVIFGGFAAPVYGFNYDNPAEEAFSKTRFELLFPELAFGADNNLFNLGNLNIDLTEPGVKTDFLAQLGKGSFTADFSSQLRAGLTIGRFSVHLRPWATGSLRLAPGIPELIFDGYGPEEDGTTKIYKLEGTKENGLVALSLDFKYGHPIELPNDAELGVGLTFRYIQGLAMFDSELTNGTLTVDRLGDCTIKTIGRNRYTELPGLENDEDGNLDVGALFQSPPGSGVLVDLGVAYEKDRLHAGLALKNIGALTWRKICQETFSYEGAVDTGPDGAEFSEGEPVTDETVLYNYTMSIPIVLQIQGSYQVFKNVYWHLGMETGFGDGWGISSSPCFQTGMEWRPQHLVRLAGDLAYHNRHLNYQALCELRLFCLWTCFQVGWIHDLGGLNGSAMLALHF